MKINVLRRVLMLVLVAVLVGGCCMHEWDWTEEVHVRDGVAYRNDDPFPETWASLWPTTTYKGGTGELHLYREEGGTRGLSDWLKLYNFVAYYRCAVEQKYRMYVRVAEIRDTRLTHQIDGQQYLAYPSPSHSTSPYFRRAPLSLQLATELPRGNGSYISDDRWVNVLAKFEPVLYSDISPDRDWSPQEGVINLSAGQKNDPPLKWPAWIPRERIVAEHFIGTLKSGFLFAGSEPDQYFWLSNAR